MTHTRKCVAISVVALVLAATGCASTASTPRKHDTSRPVRDAPSSEIPSSSTDQCGAGRAAGLTTFNGDGSKRWSVDLPVDENGEQTGPVAGHDVIFSGHAGSVSAVRAADGSVEWDEPLGSEIFSMWLIDGTLVANVDQVSDHAKFVGLDPATGAQRWTYPVPGDGFIGDAVVTEGGLAFRVADNSMLTVIDASTGHVRWTRDVEDPRSADDLPSVAPGLVLYVDAEQQMYGLDARTGSVKWQVPAGSTGRVVVSGNVGVVMPDSSSGPTITVFAHSLTDGSEVWRHKLADISAVFADEAGFLLLDYRADTMTLVRAPTGTPIWQAQLRKIDNLDQPPASISSDGALAVVERNSVAFVDRNTGDVRQVSAPTGGGYDAAGDDGLFMGSATHVLLVTPTGVSWTASIPQYMQRDPAALDDGGVVVQSEDPQCMIAD